MTSPPETSSQSGFTLFEALIALAIIALVAGLVLATNTGPSPRLRMEANISELLEEAADRRQRAVAEGSDLLWLPSATNCEGEVVEVTFFADGTASVAELCIQMEGERARLSMDPVSGRLLRAESQ